MLLSGGIDSLTCAFALTEIGIKFTPYCFYLDTNISDDLVYARKASVTFGWDLQEVKIDTSNLQKDFIELSELWGCEKKTHFECIYAFIKIIPHIKEPTVVCGAVADMLYGTSKRANIHLSKDKSKFDEYRKTSFNENPAAVLLMEGVCKHYNKKLITPFFTDSVLNFMLQYSQPELRNKQPALLSYDNYFSKVKVRKNSPYQLDSKINILFESLLETPLNYKKRSRVMDLCKDYSKRNKQLELF